MSKVGRHITKTVSGIIDMTTIIFKSHGTSMEKMLLFLKYLKYVKKKNWMIWKENTSVYRIRQMIIVAITMNQAEA